MNREEMRHADRMSRDQARWIAERDSQPQTWPCPNCGAELDASFDLGADTCECGWWDDSREE